jgi:hypothetical protein
MARIIWISDPIGFRERKARRKAHFFKFRYGWIERICTACAGSGRYDHYHSPRCGCCNGTGKERVRGPKAIARNQQG